MDDFLHQQFVKMVRTGALEECIIYFEEKLKEQNDTHFKSILGRNFVCQSEDLAQWLIRFYKGQTAPSKTVALYVEMNGFAINTDEWHCDVFGYKSCGDLADTSWLGNWHSDSDEAFELKGMEPVQQAFEAYRSIYESNKKPSVEAKFAMCLAKYLVVAHFLELVGAASAIVRADCAEMRSIKMFSTVHEWDVVWSDSCVG